MKAGYDLDLKQPKVNGRACRGLCSPELLMKRSECECQTVESPNTSVIIVTPSSPCLWARLESCQRLFSGLALGCPYRFNTPDTRASLHQRVRCALLNSPFQLTEWRCCCILAICWLMMDLSLASAEQQGCMLEKRYLSTLCYYSGSAKVVKISEETKCWICPRGLVFANVI